MKTIITTSIPAIKFDDVRKYFANCISESIAALDNDDFEHLEWYKDCSLDDYFAELPELWTDEGECLGEGFDMIFAKILLNDDTREDLENAFEQARDSEYEEALERFSDRVWDEVKDYTPYSDDDLRSSDYEKWMQDGEMNSRFDDDIDGLHVYKMFTNNHDTVINIIFADGKVYRH